MRLTLLTPDNATDFAPHRSPAPDPSIPLLIVLRAGVLVPAATQIHGSYHDVFVRLFQNALKFRSQQQSLDHLQSPPHHQTQLELQIVSYNVYKRPSSNHLGLGNQSNEPIEYPDQQIIDIASAILITGSPATAYDSEEWIKDLIEFCRSHIPPQPTTTTTTSTSTTSSTTTTNSHHPKWFGICFGHQILALALNSSVIENKIGWELGLSEIDLSHQIGKSVFGDRNPESDRPNSVLRIYQVHKDHVPTLPPSTHSLGSTARCPLQGFVRFATPHPPDPFDLSQIDIITLQGHPEFLPDILSKTIDAREESGVFSHQLAAQARERLNEHDDGVYIAAQFLKIMGI